MKYSEALRILLSRGWEVHSQKGLHLKLKHSHRSHVLIFPNHGSKELATSTWNQLNKKSQ